MAIKCCERFFIVLYQNEVAIIVMTGRVTSDSRVDMVNSSEHFSASLSRVIANIMPVVATGQAAAMVIVDVTIDGTLNSRITRNVTIGTSSSLYMHIR